MTGGGGWERQPCRRNRRLLAGMFLGGLLIGGAASCRKSAPGPEGSTPKAKQASIDVRLDPGLAVGSTDAAWWVLRVETRNRGSDLHGSLEVRGLLEDPADPDRLLEDPVAYVKAVDLPGGSPVFTEHIFAVRPEGWKEVQVTLRGDKPGAYIRVPLSPNTPANAGPAHMAVLVIADAVRDLSNLETHFRAKLKAAQPNEALDPLVSFHYLPAERVRAQPLAFDPYALVILYGSALEGAPDSTVAALRRHVAAGGTLLAVPGPPWNGALTPELLQLLGIRSFTQESGVVPAEESTTVGPAVAHVRTEGAGRVAVLWKDPAPGTYFPSEGDAPYLYDALAPTFARAFGFVGHAVQPLRSIEDLAPNVLFSMCGFKPPAAGAVLLGGLAYLCFAFLLPRLLFRSPKRRHWVFPWILLASLAAVGLIAGLGLLNSLDEAEVNELSIVRLSADGTQARVSTFLGVISPTPRTLEIPSPPPVSELETESPFIGSVAQPLRSSPGFPRYNSSRVPPVSPIDLSTDARGAPHLPGLFFYPNSMRFFRFDYDAALPAAFRVQRICSGSDSRCLRLTNDSSRPIEPFLVRDGKAWRLRRVPPSLTAGGMTDPLEAGSPEGWSEDPTFLYGWNFDRAALTGNVRDVVLRLLAQPRMTSMLYGGRGWTPMPQGNAGKTGEDADSVRFVPWGNMSPILIAVADSASIFPAFPSVTRRRSITIYVTEVSPWQGR